MTDTFESLIAALRAEDAALNPVGMEARVRQFLDAARPRPRALFAMQALRTLPVVLAMVIGGAAGAGAMSSQDNLSAFSAMPAYSVLQLVQ